MTPTTATFTVTFLYPALNCSLTQLFWSEFQSPHAEEQAWAKRRILWEQWTPFCAPHNKFPPPPAAPQKKKENVPQWQSMGVDASQQELLSHFGWFFWFQSVLCLRFMMLSWGSTVREWWIIWGRSGKSRKRTTASLLLSTVYKSLLLIFPTSTSNPTSSLQVLACDIWYFPRKETFKRCTLVKSEDVWNLSLCVTQELSHCFTGCTQTSKHSLSSTVSCPAAPCYQLLHKQ